MSKLLITLFLAAAAFGQTGTPIVDVATGTRCTAAFSPATAATHIQIDCYSAANLISTNRMIISAITGVTNGFSVSFAVPVSGGPGDQVTMVVRRTTPTANIQIDTIVNGGAPITKSVAVP